jgi:ADP-dependent NAD(P)H-hydrate dehydratase
MNLPCLLNKQEILKRYKPISKDTHKGIQGHALIIGGSYGKIGSVVLASKSALKSGCGLVTALIPKCGYNILQTSFPEAMVLTDKSKKFISEIKFDLKVQSIGIGPGLGQHLETQNAFYKFLKYNKTHLVIDADALNILSQNKDWLALLPENTILTPHQKELERLIGLWDSESEKNEKVIQFSKNYNIIVVVKGAPTMIIDGENLYQNTTGNPALATAGSGDVLTGIITGLLAQSYNPIDAVLLGVYIHGFCADLYTKIIGNEAFIASDIINNLGASFLDLNNSS